jgi:hypothetical protein
MPRILTAVIAIVVTCAAAIPLRSAAQAIPNATPSATPPAIASPSPSPTASQLPLVPAGVVPPDAAVELAGTNSAAFVTSRIEAAIAQGAQLQPGATLAVRGVTIAQPLVPGVALEAQAQVQIDGHGRFADAVGTTSVHLHVDTLPVLNPTLLFYSDDPEMLGAGDDGVLFRGTFDIVHPARAYVYHVSRTPGRRLALVLQAAGAATRVQILGAAAGPSGAWAYVGHVSTDRYLLERAPQQSFVTTIPAGAPYVFPLGAFTQRSELLDAIYDLRVLQGGPVQALIVAAGAANDPSPFVSQPELRGDGHGRRGEYGLVAVPPLALSYVAGGAEPVPFAVGYPVVPNLRPGGRALGGDYGVLREVALKLTNPSTIPQSVSLYEMLGNTGGGGTTTTIWFTGDPAPTEVPCVRTMQKRYLVKEFTLGAGEIRTVTGEYMTDGTSSFPLFFGLTRNVPPAPEPHACG